MKIAHDSVDAAMFGHGHDLAHWHALTTSLSDKPRAQTVCRPIACETGQFGAALDNTRHLVTGQPIRADLTASIHAPKQWARSRWCRFQPGRQGVGSGAAQRFFPARAAGVGLGDAQGVDPSVGIQLAHIVDCQSDHFRAAAPATAPGQQQQGAVTNAAHAVVAGGEQRLQRFQHDRGFFAYLKPLAALRLARFAQQCLDGSRFGWTAPAIELVPFTQYRQAMTNGVVGQGTGFGLDARADQCCVDRQWQQVSPSVVFQRPGQMIEDELQRYGCGQWRVPERLTVAQLQPGRPIGQGAAIAAHSIGGGAGSDKRRRRFLRVNCQEMLVQRGFLDQRQLIRKIYNVQRIKTPVIKL